MKTFCWRCAMPMTEDVTVCPHCGFDASAYTAASHQLPPETLLSGRYAIGSVLGEGGFGITYVGYDPRLKRELAIKEFYMQGFVSRVHTYSFDVQISVGKNSEIFQKNRDRFLEEAQVLATFSENEGIVGIYDYFRENNTAYIVMPLLKGQTLKAHLQSVGRLSWEETFRIMRPVLVSLAEVHQHNVIHRDISPDNLMMTDHGIKLLDFGAAREFSQQGERSLSVILKPGYAPYEQYTTKGKQGPWTDVYALCATMYRCLTGIVPEDSMNRILQDSVRPPKELCDCPDHISDTLMRGLSILWQDRIQSVDQLLYAMEASQPDSVAIHPISVPPEPADDPDRTVLFASEEPVTGVPVRTLSPKPSAPKREARKSPLRWALSIGAATILLLAFLLLPKLRAKSDGITPAGSETAMQETDEQESAKTEESVAVGHKAESVETEIPDNEPFCNVVTAGDNGNLQCNVSEWADIVAVAACSNHTVGLRADGTVVAVGFNDDGQCDVSDWTDIVAIAAGDSHTVGLRADGTVVTAGSNFANQRQVYDWSDIVAVAAGTAHTVGLRADGTVAAVGRNFYGGCDVSDWTDIVAIAAGYEHTVGLRADGTVVAVGCDNDDQCNVSNWTDIVDIAALGSHTVGLRSDGTVVATGDNTKGQCDIWDWTDIVDVAAGDEHTVGLRADGTVVAVGRNIEGQCKISDWTGIAAIEAGDYYTLGIKEKPS